MVNKKESIQNNILLNTIIDGIKKYKGKDVVSFDLRKIEKAVCDFFVICHGSSSTHVASIAENVKRYVSKSLREKPWHIEGKSNKEWILIDYIDTVVHIFAKEKRDFYNLENLWADAQIKYTK